MAYGTKCGESISDIFLTEKEVLDELTTGYISVSGLCYSNSTSISCSVIGRLITQPSSVRTKCVEQIFKGSTGCHLALIRKVSACDPARTRLQLLGKNDHGQLGTFNNNWCTMPQNPIDCADYSHAAMGSSHTLAVKVDGSLWSWGRNNCFQLGITNTISRSSPVQVSVSGWKKVAAGEFSSYAITSNNSLYAWGKSDHGQSGVQSVSNTTLSVPLFVGSDYKCVQAGSDYALALKTDNTLWTWGYNVDGRLGLGDTISRSSPVQICVGKQWKKISAGYRQAAAIDIDNKLYVWGCNERANLGLGTTIPQMVSCPVQIAPSVSWREVSLNCDIGTGISSTGHLYTWGCNVCLMLGLGVTTCIQSSPTSRIEDNCSSSDWENVVATDKSVYFLSRSNEF